MKPGDAILRVQTPQSRAREGTAVEVASPVRTLETGLLLTYQVVKVSVPLQYWPVIN